MFDKMSLIKQSGEGNLAVQNSEIYVTVSIYDEIDRLVKQGKYNEVADCIKYINDFVGTKHPLYPHYRYKPVQFGKTTIFEHEALSAEALEKYPLSYRGKFNISNDLLEGYNDVNELIEDAYFKQEEIEINMFSLTTWLGEHPIETPNLDSSLKDGKWMIVPKKLPDPLRLKFYIKDILDISIIDYLEMSISGREGNDFIFIDNSRQENIKLLISLKLPINQDIEKECYKSSSAKVNVKIKPEFKSNVEAHRYLLYFLKSVVDGNKTIVFKNLQEDKDFLVASSFSYDGDIFNLDKDYNFIERLYKIENHYKLSFTVPEKMDKSDWEAIEILEHAMKNKPIKQNLKKFTVELNDKETIQNLIELFESEENVKKLMIEQTGPEARIELFDEIISIEKVRTIFNSLKIDDLERLRGKLEYMDEGESIKVVFIPGIDPEYNEYYYCKQDS